MSSPKIELLTNNVLTIGEGPHWDPQTQALYYVDALSTKIYRHTPSNGKTISANVGPLNTSFIIPIAGKPNEFIVSVGNSLVQIRWHGQADNEQVEILKILATVGPADHSFNDAKCDANGRLWAGTLIKKIEDFTKIEATGVLYSFDGKRTKQQESKIKVSNGLAFDYKLKRFYYIDSLKRTVDQFDFDLKQETITNRQEIFSFDKHQITGLPDGMTIDSDGNLWVATFGSSRIIQIDPRRPNTLLNTINMPVKQITSLAFGGNNLTELYVTTGAFVQSSKDDLPTPQNGGLYRITNINAKGLPADNFKI